VSAFRKDLDGLRHPGSAGDRRWIFVPHDQLTDRLGPLADLDPDEAGLVLIESEARARRRPYHRQKLAPEFANQRHFALEQARRGVAVEDVEAEAPLPSPEGSATGSTWRTPTPTTGSWSRTCRE